MINRLHIACLETQGVTIATYDDLGMHPLVLTVMVESYLWPMRM